MRITELFDNGEFVVTAEVGPPKGIHIDGMVEEAKLPERVRLGADLSAPEGPGPSGRFEVPHAAA